MVVMLVVASDPRVISWPMAQLMVEIRELHPKFLSQMGKAPP